MREFGVPGLNTVRHPQQLLVREGVLDTEQSVGALGDRAHEPSVGTRATLERLAQSRSAIDDAIDFMSRETRTTPSP